MKLSTQQQAILNLLRLKPEVHVSEITNDKRFGGLGIKGYTERMTELRDKGYGISNVRKCVYTLSYDPEQKATKPVEDHQEVVMTLEQQLERLRREYVAARNAKDTQAMSRIELQAKVLKIGMKQPEKPQIKETDQLQTMVMETLL